MQDRHVSADVKKKVCKVRLFKGFSKEDGHLTHAFILGMPSSFCPCEKLEANKLPARFLPHFIS